ncbi:MAG: hypothetical protein J6574_02710, partial [Gilliamella sp.]|nr:hypothetical protein [Gilliamella sp.]
VDGVTIVPSNRVIFNKSSVVIALVLPPSNVKYGALPSITLLVCAVNACKLGEYGNNNNGTNTNVFFVDNCMDNFDAKNEVSVKTRLTWLFNKFKT